MDDRITEKQKKTLEDYRKLIEGWPLEPTVEERLAALREAQAMEPRSKIAEECLAREHEILPPEKQRSQMWKWLHQKPKNKN